MYKVVIIKVVIILLSIALFVLGIRLISSNDYKSFKENTSIIKGNVKDKYIQKHNSNKVYYLAISQKNNNDVLINVNEAEYKAYKQEAKVKFRVALNKDNKTIVDLYKNHDIDSKKTFKEYQKQKNSEIWSGFKIEK